MEVAQASNDACDVIHADTTEEDGGTGVFEEATNEIMPTESEIMEENEEEEETVTNTQNEPELEMTTRDEGDNTDQNNTGVAGKDITPATDEINTSKK
eukprot:7897451-Ditylum_brightwellii.AAC.1